MKKKNWRYPTSPQNSRWVEVGILFLIEDAPDIYLGRNFEHGAHANEEDTLEDNAHECLRVLDLEEDRADDQSHDQVLHQPSLSRVRVSPPQEELTKEHDLDTFPGRISIPAMKSGMVEARALGALRLEAAEYVLSPRTLVVLLDKLLVREVHRFLAVLQKLGAVLGRESLRGRAT